MLYTKIQPQRILKKTIFKSFLPYMVIATILFNGVEPFEQIVYIPLT